MRIIFLLLFAMFSLYPFVAKADQIHDKAAELVAILYENPSEELVQKEIDDATIRVRRRYKDDNNGEFIIIGYQSKWQLKEPADEDILARLNAKYNSVLNSLNQQD